MFSITTFDIKVTVYPEYDSKNSFPSENRFVFRYHVTIENLSDHPILLLRRRWLIYDVGFGYTEVEGEGVIGLTPEIGSGETFKYFSNVVLRSGVGSMGGTYYCTHLSSQEDLKIEIPKFNLLAEILYN